MLAKDGVHPTEKGAEAMADRFLVDFPEIKITKGEWKTNIFKFHLL